VPDNGLRMVFHSSLQAASNRHKAGEIRYPAFFAVSPKTLTSHILTETL
jgi:hypothetical protein